MSRQARRKLDRSPSVRAMFERQAERKQAARTRRRRAEAGVTPAMLQGLDPDVKEYIENLEGGSR